MVMDFQIDEHKPITPDIVEKMLLGDADDTVAIPHDLDLDKQAVDDGDADDTWHFT